MKLYYSSTNKGHRRIFSSMDSSCASFINDIGIPITNQDVNDFFEEVEKFIEMKTLKRDFF